MKEKLHKYFFDQMSRKEKKHLFDDLDQSKEAKKEFSDQLHLLSVAMMDEKPEDLLYAEKNYSKFKRKTRSYSLQRRALQVAKYAAVVLLTVGLWTFYQNTIRNVNKEISYVYMEAPAGQRAHLILPDGTGVWLNAQSRLSYTTDFSSKNRVVQLEGEGYFEVTSDEENPFIVHAERLNIRVTGTKFNIRSYNEEISLVTLLEGKVEVSNTEETNKYTLQPNEQASVTITGDITHSQSLGVENVNSWISGGFYYLNEPLSDIARDLERRFNVSIRITDKSLADEMFTYRADGSATLFQILRHLKGTNELDYRMNGEHIEIVER